MAGDVYIDARQVEQFRRELSRFEESLDDLKDLHRKAAEPVWQEQKARAPLRTGRLMRSVKFSATKTGARTYVRKSKSLPYANMQEFGGHVGWVGKGGRKIQMAGRHVAYYYGKGMTRVPVHGAGGGLGSGNIRSMSHALIEIKPRREGGYWFFPAFRDRMERVVEVYGAGLERLMRKYFD